LNGQRDATGGMDHERYRSMSRRTCDGMLR